MDRGLKFEAEGSVTADHISRGVRNSITSCPVALALKNCFPGEHVEVRRSSATIARQYFARLPIDVSEFIVRFDNGQPVEPITFIANFDLEWELW